MAFEGIDAPVKVNDIGLLAIELGLVEEVGHKGEVLSLRVGYVGLFSVAEHDIYSSAFVASGHSGDNVISARLRR